MAAVARHMIKQQILEVKIANREDQEAVTESLVKIYNESIGEIIDEICNELVPIDQQIRIDSLEIDLGRFAMRQLANDFPIAARKSLSEALIKKIGSKQERIGRGSTTQVQSAKNALVHYLSTGLIPWYYHGDLAELKTEFSAEKIDQLLDYKKVFMRTASQKRSIHFFAEESLFYFILENGPKDSKNILSQFKALRLVLDKLAKRNEVKLVKEAKIHLEQLEIGKPAYEKLMVYLLANTLGSSAPKISLANLLSPGLMIEKVVELLENREVKKLQLLSPEEQNCIEDFILTRAKAPEKNITVKKTETELSTEKVNYGEDGLVVNNAGLVLVWPYLEAFFTGLKLMKNQEFKDHNSQVKAVQLLHYLGFGSLQATNETEWLLNKLLSGLEAGEFVADGDVLTDSDKQEGEHLLTTLITNWPALKNTGADSLRQTFLQRNGLLERNDKGWTLKVERKAVDVLLDRLSWPISVIKLPWNNYIINTIW